MPENYYCLDNFFQKMTDLESPRKNNDCYFYYYSTCTKGDNCTFRHEPSALGCETTCSFWKEGKCINVRCNFRHMELRKNRKTIPCYWESQPSGCKKQHCPFMHVTKKNEGDENENLSDEHDDLCNLKSKKDEFAAPVVDPIVVNFEEESDNESSAPTQSPHKTPHPPLDHLRHTHEQRPTTASTSTVLRRVKNVQVKTLEEIKLDRIQAESAAYYSYSDELTPKLDENDAANGRRSIFKRLQPLSDGRKPIEDVQVLTLDEIRRRKRKPQHESNEVDITKKPKKVASIEESSLSEIKIKTLAEIKAEKQIRLKRKVDDEESIAVEEKPVEAAPKRVRITFSKELDEQEVTSTSKTDDSQPNKLVQDPEMDTPKVQCVVAPLKRSTEVEPCDILQEQSLEKEKEKPEIPQTLEHKTDAMEKTVLEDTSKSSSETSLDIQGSCTKRKSLGISNMDDSKLDELLLADDDDDMESGSLAEDDILNDIDDLLKE